MRPQKTVATIMFLVSSVLITATSRGDMAYPVVLCILGLIGLQRRLTWDIKPDRRVIRSWLLLGLAILLALHYRYAPRAWAGQEQAIALAWQTVSRYFLAAMVLTLFLGSANELPPSFGMFHIAITVCTGQILLLDDLLVLFRLLEFLSVILVVLYAATATGAQWQRTKGKEQEAEPSAVRRLSAESVAVLILIIAANMGWITGSLLYRHVEILNYLPLWLARQGTILELMASGTSSVGFSTSGRLSSMLTVLQEQDSTVALTIESRNPPGYLRGRAFDSYRSSEWDDRSSSEALYPSESSPLNVSLGGRSYTFRLSGAPTSDLEYMTIRHESDFHGAAFAPPGAVIVESSLPLLRYDSDGIVYVPGLADGKAYRVGYSLRAFRNEPGGIELRRMLNLPNQLDPRVTELAHRIFAGHATVADKIDAVVDYFREHYTYSLSMDIPEDQDKLMYFLLSSSSGYCEYFASGAAILLRAAGVPTRYVTGFFVTQRGDRSGSWIARNMDAHAWAEAWDTERKSWVIVEATVQGGANTSSSTAGSGQADTSFGARLKRLAEAVYEYGILGLIGWLFTSYGLFAGSLTLSIILGCTLWYSLTRLRRRYEWAVLGAHSTQPPAIVAMHRMLAQMDRGVRAMGLRRQPAETLQAFATRIASCRAWDAGSRPADYALAAASWYLRYASLRYAASITAEQLQALRQHAQTARNRR